MDYEKITEALKILKNMCCECRFCSECPCSGEDGRKCLISARPPQFWNVTEPKMVARCLLEDKNDRV